MFALGRVEYTTLIKDCFRMTQCLTNTDVGHYQWIFLKCQLYNGTLMFNYFELRKCIIKRDKTPTILCCFVWWGGGGLQLITLMICHVKTLSYIFFIYTLNANSLTHKGIFLYYIYLGFFSLSAKVIID